MTDTATLQTQLDNLKAARRSGVRAIWIGERRVDYKSDREMVAAIASLANEIAKLENTQTPRSVVVRSTKGWSK
jgi:hypothetical protein